MLQPPIRCGRYYVGISLLIRTAGKIRNPVGAFLKQQSLKIAKNPIQLRTLARNLSNSRKRAAGNGTCIGYPLDFRFRFDFPQARHDSEIIGEIESRAISQFGKIG